MSAVVREDEDDGIRAHVPYADYASRPGTNISTLKEIDVSPKRYRWRLTHPRESRPMRLGKAAHVAVLEPERFERSYAVWDQRTDEGNLRPMKSKDFSAFKARAGGREIITIDDYDRAVAIRDAVRSNEIAMRYLCEGAPEVSMEWTDAETGVACRGRLDWLTAEGGIPVIAGLKTARDIRPRQFQRQAVAVGYPEQWAFYFDGLLARRRRAAKVVEIVVGNTDEFDVGVYIVPSDVIEYGHERYREWLVKLEACRAADHWPGAMERETLFELPPWAVPQNDAEDAADGLEGFDDDV